ncbi:MAG: Pol I core factor CF [Bathelium mastoideum]|nr:MAG: Pol I core factor CF [Bathelium mastoideum]
MKMAQAVLGDMIIRNSNGVTLKQTTYTSKVQAKLQQLGKRKLTREFLSLILWKQASWLVNVKGLPKEFEVVVRDIWALRLQKLAGRIDLEEEEDDATGTSSSQLYSASADSEAEGREEPARRHLSDIPSLLETLASCYLGIVLLRLPISPGDIQYWAASGALLYNRALAAIPEDMRTPLDPLHAELFETRVILRVGHLQSAVVNLSRAYHQEYQMHFPPINLPILLYRYIKQLALPLEIYPCVRNLAPVINFAFSYPPEVKRDQLSFVPDAQIISLIIVATKLLYPVSSHHIYPTTSTEPASLAMNWQKWLAAKRAHHAKFSRPGRLDYLDAYTARESDVFAWNDTQMDDYLEWYKRTWAQTEPPADNDFRRAMFDLFPIDTDAPPATPEGLNEDLTPNAEALEASRQARIRAVQKGRKQRRVVSDKDGQKRARAGKATSRPGSLYDRFKHAEDLDKPKGGNEAMRALYEEAAKMVELPLKTVVWGVFRTEELFNKWIRAEEKLERQGKESASAEEHDTNRQGSDDNNEDEDMEDV